jgi:hypothetical protein
VDRLTAGVVVQPDALAEQDRRDVEIDLVDQSQFEQLTADGRPVHFEVLAAGRFQPIRTASARPQFRNVTPSAGVASSGWWVSTKIGPSQAPL